MALSAETPLFSGGVSQGAGAAADVARVAVDTSLYGLESVFRACYKFTDRAFVFMERGERDQIVVHLRLRSAAGDGHAMAELVGLFQNDLIDQRLRADLARETRAVRDWVVAQAFVEAELDVPPR